ncbi:MAG: deoxyribonuclease IV [Deferribacteraceae bacterium]|jgi:deoxyribonuclease-4|nr:deoxyribonuclease IV [Deferribacteraceae bacterium]
MKLGAHESASGGVHNVIGRAFEDGCESLQLFVKSPNRWAASALTHDEVRLFLKQGGSFGFSNIVAHSAYLINLASPKDDVRKKSVILMKDELSRCDLLRIPFYVVHPGSPIDDSFETGIGRIVQGIDEVYSDHGISAALLLESTAGMGNSIGGKFEHLQMICDRVKRADKIGVCLDICHIHAAGYDITEKYAQIIDEVNERFGDKIRVIHINDSKNPAGTRKDRHELIGKGTVGIETFRSLVNDKRFKDVLGIVETPVEDGRYKAELDLLKSLRNGVKT